MKWINEHKPDIRIIFLILLVVAISGPWFFDRIHVPSPYTCSAPNMRLDDEFCGLPLSITWFFSSSIEGLRYIVTGVVTGALRSGDASRQSLVYLFLYVLMLPVLRTAILILRGDDYRRGHMLHKVLLGLAASIGGWTAWLSYSRASWVLWGLWLYIGLTIGMLGLEVLISKIPRKLVQE